MNNTPEAVELAQIILTAVDKARTTTLLSDSHIKMLHEAAKAVQKRDLVQQRKKLNASYKALKRN